MSGGMLVLWCSGYPLHAEGREFEPRQNLMFYDSS